MNNRKLSFSFTFVNKLKIIKEIQKLDNEIAC